MASVHTCHNRTLSYKVAAPKLGNLSSASWGSVIGPQNAHLAISYEVQLVASLTIPDQGLPILHSAIRNLLDMSTLPAIPR